MAAIAAADQKKAAQTIGEQNAAVEAQAAVHTLAAASTGPQSLEATTNALPSFKNRFARTEIQKLSPEEIKYIEEMAKVLATETLVFKVADAKPIGAKLRLYQEDYTGFYLKAGANVDLKKLSNGIITSLSPAQKAVAGLNIEFNHASLYPDPNSRNHAVLAAKFYTPPGTASVDDRPISNEYTIILSRGIFTERFASGERTDLLPFIVKQAAMLLTAQNPNLAVFFDGVMSGRDGLYGEGKNPCLSSDFINGRYFYEADTSLGEDIKSGNLEQITNVVQTRTRDKFNLAGSDPRTDFPKYIRS